MTTTQARHGADYLFDSGTDLGLEQLEYLEVLLDDRSIEALTATGVRNGWHCLEVGAGSGSIARWLADRVRPDGGVLAVDMDTRRLSEGPGLEVRRHDLAGGVPEGPFDLIHARLVLMHLPRRREIVTELIDGLAPGGWLVLGEFLGPEVEPLQAPGRAEAELFRHVMEDGIDRVGRPAGISYGWAHEVDEYLVQAGLVNVHTERHQETTSGGETGCLLMGNYFRQAEAPMRAAGFGADELAGFDSLMHDPRLRVWNFEFTSVRAQKPW